MSQAACILALFDPDCLDALDQVRREAAQTAEQMKAAQKNAGRDRAWASFFKEEAAHALKTYRGACLVLGHFVTDKGDCPARPTSNWPAEIVPHAAIAVALAEAMPRALDSDLPLAA